MFFSDITYNQIKKIKDTKKLLDYTKPVHSCTPKLLKPFFDNRVFRYGTDGMWGREYTPSFARFKKNSNCRVCVVEIDDDYVLVLLKNISFFKNKFTRISFLPQSLNNNTSNEEKVLSALINNKLINQVTFIEKEWDLINKLGLEPDGVLRVDYYNIIEERFKYVNTGKWMRGCHIRRVFGNNNFVFRQALPQDIKKMYELSKRWEEKKNKDGHNTSGIHFIYKVYDYLEFQDPDDVLAYNLFYRDMLLVSMVFFKGVNPYYLRCEADFNIAMTDYMDFSCFPEEDRVFLSKLTGYFSKYLLYFVLQDFLKKGVVAYYYGSDGTQAKLLNTLKIHKKIFTDHVKTIYKTKIF